MADDYALNHKHGLSKNQSTSSAFSRLGPLIVEVKLIKNHSQAFRRRQKVPVPAGQRKPKEELRDLHPFAPTVRRRGIQFLNVTNFVTKRNIIHLVSHSLMHVPPLKTP